MTVRFLTSWNGYSAGDRATLTNEAALISAGIARNDYVQDGVSPLYPPNRDYATAVVGAAGVLKFNRRTTPLRVASFGDSTANLGSSLTDISTATTTFAAKSYSSISLDKWQLPTFYPQAYIVANGGVSGETTTQMLARDTATVSTTRKSIADVLDTRPDVVLLRGGSTNDLTGVTSATLASVVATTYANHVKIINRFVSCGVFVVDEGIYAYSGTAATDPASTRLALLQLNSMFAAYAETLPGKVKFIDWTNILRDANGYFLPNVASGDGLGLHLSAYGQYLAAQQESAALNFAFGVSSTAPRYPGANVLKNAAVVSANMNNNSLYAATTSPGYGTVPTGCAWNISNGTRQNAAVEAINGKFYATCECAASAANNFLTFFAPLDTANFVPAVGDVYGVEFDIYIAGTGGALPPMLKTMSGSFNFTSGGNNIAITAGQIAYPTLIPNASGFFAKLTFPPFVFPADTSTLTVAELFFKVTTDDVVTWKMGVAHPRLVKLNQAVVML